MIDFKRTHLLRRTIYQALQQGQKSESHAAERNQQIAVTGQQALLLLLSKWLLELNPASVTSEAKFREMQSLTQISLDKWIQFQAVAVQNEKDLAEAEGKLREAEGAYKKKAPFGGATKLLAGAESRSQIKALQDNLDAARGRCESLSRTINTNVKNRQALAETFFRDCLKQPEKLVTTQALGKEAEVIVGRMVRETNAIWEGHLKQQTEELNQIVKQIDSLRENYKDTTAAPSQQYKALYKAPSPQEQEDERAKQGNFYDFKE